MDESALDLFMAGLSDSQIWMPFLIAIGIGALVFGGFKARAFVICLGISLGNRGTGHECIKIQRGPSPTKTRSDCSDGAVTKSPAKVSYPF